LAILSQNEIRGFSFAVIYSKIKLFVAVTFAEQWLYIREVKKMNRNPLIPFFIIMLIGIGLTLGLSFKGLGDAKELAKEKKGGEKTEQTAAANPEEFYQQTCSGCHGQNYEGGAGPALKGVGQRLSVDEIKNVLQNGRGGMPAGLVPPDKADEMAKWLSKLK
jgi:cytochrome c550